MKNLVKFKKNVKRIVSKKLDLFKRFTRKNKTSKKKYL